MRREIGISGYSPGFRLSARPPRPDMPGSCPRLSPGASHCPMLQWPSEESVWRRRYHVGGEQTIDRLAHGVDCPVEIFILALHLDVRLVDPVALVDRLHSVHGVCSTR